MNTPDIKPSLEDLRDYDIEVCRTGYAFGSVRVQAKSAQEANQRALEVAGDLEYSEKSADYELSVPAPEPKEASSHQRSVTLYASINARDGNSIPLWGLVHEITPEKLARWREFDRILHEHDLSEMRYFCYPGEWITDKDIGDASELDDSLEVPEALLMKGTIAFVGVEYGSGREMTTMPLELSVIEECFSKGIDVIVNHDYSNGAHFLELTDLNADDFISGSKRMLLKNPTSTAVVASEEADIVFGHRSPAPVQRG